LLPEIAMAENIKVACIIMASGFSRRMGSNKLLLDLGGAPVISRVLESLPYPVFDRVLLVAKDAQVLAVGSSYPLICVTNDSSRQGKSRAIQLGIEASGGVSGYLFLVADQPLLKSTTISGLVEVFRKRPGQIIQPVALGKPRNPVIFPTTLKDQLLALRADSGGKEVIAKHQDLVYPVNFSLAEEFQDIDNPAAYKKILGKF
jgi:molybdenum cofactor cytidylyltransferase